MKTKFLAILALVLIMISCEGPLKVKEVVTWELRDGVHGKPIGYEMLMYRCETPFTYSIANGDIYEMAVEGTHIPNEDASLIFVPSEEDLNGKTLMIVIYEYQ